MDRTITGFCADEAGLLVARLACGHGWRGGPAVAPADATQAEMGGTAACARCDRLELPAGFEVYKTTRLFNQDTVPKGLLADHTTRRGVWGRICVLSGELDYVVAAPVDQTLRLGPSTPGIIPAEQPHHVVMIGVVEFRVEFLRAPLGGETTSTSGEDSGLPR